MAIYDEVVERFKSPLFEKENMWIRKKGSKIKIYGNDDMKVSPYLKAWIAQPDKEGKISSCVVGLIGPGTSRQLQCTWNSPFEQSNLGSVFEKTGGALQMATGLTTITSLASTQIWEGNKPHALNLVLLFYAKSDAAMEVMGALSQLEQYAAPTPDEGSPANRIPAPIILNIGRTSMFTDCVIESIAIGLDKEKDKHGNLVRAEATLSIATKKMLMKADIAKTWA